MVDSVNHLIRHVEEYRTDRKRLCPWYYFCSDEMHLCGMPWKASQTSFRAAGISMQWVAAPSQGPSLGSKNSSCLQSHASAVLLRLVLKLSGLVTLPAGAEFVLSWAEHLALAAATCFLALIPAWRPNHIMPLAWVRRGSTLFTYPSHCIVLSF